MFLLVRIWLPLGAECIAFAATTGAKDPFKKSQQILLYWLNSLTIIKVNHKIIERDNLSLLLQM